jgi:hypothetical protein
VIVEAKQSFWDMRQKLYVEKHRRPKWNGPGPLMLMQLIYQSWIAALDYLLAITLFNLL